MSSRAFPNPPPLTIEDLMARWQVSEDIVKEHIRSSGLPYWDAGTGRGRRPIYRFRLADVEAWEASRVRVKTALPPQTPVPPSLVGAPASWDGKFRALGRGKARPPKRRETGA